MPELESTTVGVAFDLAGCPNRCRHCYLGVPGSEHLSTGDARRIAREFRASLAGTSVERLTFASWIWEPDFDDAYRDLYSLEAELSDTPPARYELLSVWRLARDETYAPWARSVGPRTCQITLFGLEETTDWFCRRLGTSPRSGFRCPENRKALEDLVRWCSIPGFRCRPTSRGSPAPHAAHAHVNQQRRGRLHLSHGYLSLVD